MNINNSINKLLCNNCGKKGHLFHQCKLHITSHGIILFRKKNGIIQFLMIRRKDSFGYIDFIRGKYSPYNPEKILITINEMSNYEKNNILTLPFDELWCKMWGNTNKKNTQYKNEEITSKKRFETITNGVIVDNKEINLKQLVEMSSTNWQEPEWEFPKGRRNPNEKDVDCAIREFEEETGIHRKNIQIVDNIVPFEEVYIGSNHKSYKHKYFLAYYQDVDNKGDVLENFQDTEVSKIEWKTIEECLESIRPSNLEKRELIENINKVIQEYSFYL